MSPGAAGGSTAAALDRFRDRLDTFREAVESRLSAFLAERERSCGGDAVPLVEAVRTLVLAGGKRLRPALVYFSYRGCGGRDEEAVFPLAMSAELLHTYLLIHDDIMDHARLRRGQPAAHVRFAHRHRRQGWPGEAADYGRSMAILAGDLAYTWAIELFERSLQASASPEREPGASAKRGDLAAAFGRMCQEVIVGQFLEMHLPHDGDAREEDLLRILRLKSGRYSVERPLELGALLAGADDRRLRALAEYGRAVGEAFQLQDDLLGMFGEERAVGKPVGSDLREGKRTLLVYHALHGASPEEARRLRGLLGRSDLGPQEVEEARQLMSDSGALGIVREMIDQRLARAGRALETLDRLTLDADAYSFLEGLIAYSRERDR